MAKISLQCQRMATVATEYCTFIDGFSGQYYGAGRHVHWLMRLEKLLPRLHVAVIALAGRIESVNSYQVYNDDQRCELFLHLIAAIQADQNLWVAYEASGTRQQSRQELCECMADNLADMYFDLKYGLDLIRENPAHAASEWQRSFYAHWGKHLLHAECWLHAVDAGDEPPHLPEWRWPDMLSYTTTSPA